MKEKMVVGFIFSFFGDILLVRKDHPAWQKGKLNGIGGHIKFNELPIEAIHRECLEETGLDLDGWKHVCVMEGAEWIVDVFTTEVSDETFKSFENKTNENIEVHHVGTIWDEITVPNVKFLVPMCLEHINNPFTFLRAKIDYD
jgi:8-oxo-dGTP diphosphatase